MTGPKGLAGPETITKRSRERVGNAEAGHYKKRPGRFQGPLSGWRGGGGCRVEDGACARHVTGHASRGHPHLAPYRILVNSMCPRARRPVLLISAVFLAATTHVFSTHVLSGPRKRSGRCFIVSSFVACDPPKELETIKKRLSETIKKRSPETCWKR